MMGSFDARGFVSYYYSLCELASKSVFDFMGLEANFNGSVYVTWRAVRPGAKVDPALER